MKKYDVYLVGTKGDAWGTNWMVTTVTGSPRKEIICLRAAVKTKKAARELVRCLVDFEARQAGTSRKKYER